MDYNKQIEQEVSRYRKAVTTIRTSDNPYYSENLKVQDYEIAKLRDELEKKVSDISDQFNSVIDTQIVEFEEKAAKSYFRPSESDRKLVGAILGEFKTDILLAYTEADKADVFDRLEKKLGYLDDANALYEVKTRLPELVQALGHDESTLKKLKGINSTLQALKTPEQAELDELKESKMNGVDWDFRRLRMTHPSFSDHRHNMHNPNKPPL